MLQARYRKALWIFALVWLVFSHGWFVYLLGVCPFRDGGPLLQENVFRLAAIIWALGTAAMALGQFASYQRFRRRALEGMVPVEESWIRSVCIQAAKEAGCGTVSPLYRSRAVSTPLVLGFAVPAVALVAVTNATLQAFGRIDLPLISMFLGAVVKMLGDYYLIGNPEFGILGAPISTAVCYWLIALLNLFHIARLSHALPPLGKTVGRPLAATIGMGAATYLSHTVLLRVLDTAPGTLLDKLATLIAIAVAGVVYVVLLLLLRAVEREDVLLLPKGEKIANILHLK